MDYWAGYGSIALFLLVALIFGLITIILPKVLKLLGLVVRKPNAVKYTTYECGMETIGPSWVQFNFRYYIFALLFLVFDVLVVFLYPWAVSLRGGGWAAFTAMAVFIAVLLTGFLYAWKKGALEWR
ncbi:MAG: NADH-quinone oxidoreductase subunit A [Dehalococcoidia bacterium]|nr:NADH-quinone oxidoreductase subunit A [Dehalococcoidia bacterium]